MRCPKCNSLLPDDYNICPYCGTSLKTKKTKEFSRWWGLLAFFAPVYGLVYYIAFYDEKPKFCHFIIKNAIAGFIFYFICVIILVSILIIRIRSFY